MSKLVQRRLTPKIKETMAPGKVTITVSLPFELVYAKKKHFLAEGVFFSLDKAPFTG